MTFQILGERCFQSKKASCLLASDIRHQMPTCHTPSWKELTGHFANRTPDPLSPVIAQLVADPPDCNPRKQAKPVAHDSRPGKLSPHLTPEQVETLMADYQAGRTAKELGGSSTAYIGPQCQGY